MPISKTLPSVHDAVSPIFRSPEGPSGRPMVVRNQSRSPRGNGPIERVLREAQAEPLVIFGANVKVIRALNRPKLPVIVLVARIVPKPHWFVECKSTVLNAEEQVRAPVPENQRFMDRRISGEFADLKDKKLHAQLRTVSPASC